MSDVSTPRRLLLLLASLLLLVVDYLHARGRAGALASRLPRVQRMQQCLYLFFWASYENVSHDDLCFRSPPTDTRSPIRGNREHRVMFVFTPHLSHFSVFLPCPREGVKYAYVCQFVCLFVCLSARLTRKLHGGSIP